MKLKYHGTSIDEIAIPRAGVTVKRGDEFETTKELGESLLDQVDNYAPADDEARAYVEAKAAEAKAAEAAEIDAVLAEHDLSTESTVPVLKAYAAEHGIDLGSATNKPDVIAAIVSFYNEEA